VRRPVASDTIKWIHAELFTGSGIEASGFKSTKTSSEIGELCRDYLNMETSIESLLLIGTFISEFLRIQPFASGNLRTALLTAAWLLNRREYSVGCYVSVERILEKFNQEFQSALEQASMDSDRSSFDIKPWWTCWMESLWIAYQALNDRSRALSGRRGVKTDMILSMIGFLQDDFSIRQLQQLLPECGIELIRKILKEQKATGKIKCMGRGPNARWRKKKIRNAGIV